jgi:hypothetical protein
MSTFTPWLGHLQTITRDVIVKNSRGRPLPPFLHFHHPDGRDESMHVGLPADREERAAMLRTGVAELVRIAGPELVGWTFEGVQGDDAVAVVVAIDRERAETWTAPLARAGGQTLIGVFSPWPANEQAGSLITPIQEVLR